MMLRRPYDGTGMTASIFAVHLRDRSRAPHDDLTLVLLTIHMN
jgi:hypothetical protein